MEFSKWYNILKYFHEVIISMIIIAKNEILNKAKIITIPVPRLQKDFRELLVGNGNWH